MAVGGWARGLGVNRNRRKIMAENCPDASRKTPAGGSAGNHRWAERSWEWRSPLAILAFVLPHLLTIISRDRKTRKIGPASAVPETTGPYAEGTLIYTLALLAVVAVLAYAYQPPPLARTFPADYSF